MKNFFNKKINTVLSIVLVLLSVLITVHTVFAGSIISAGEPVEAAMVSRVNPKFADETMQQATLQTTVEPTESATQKPTGKSKNKKKTNATEATKATKKAKSSATEEPTVVFATAIPAEVPADYNAQWNAGYLVAIDNPDTTYKCGQVTLSDYDRDLLERLCMGEFGSGGFVGAALIAQAVKNAICFDGYTSVGSIIEGCHYTGRTDIPANDACKQAVTYIFDQNHDAVQHRIMYMYNPNLVQSTFHESQNYILTYEDVRFFDRWGY